MSAGLAEVRFGFDHDGSSIVVRAWSGSKSSHPGRDPRRRARDRMRDRAGELPKALVEVAGEPFAHHQLRLLAGQGVREVVFVIGFQGRSCALPSATEADSG